MIDLKSLEDARELALHMVEYYGKDLAGLALAEKQNAALAAAGLPPVETKRGAFFNKWDREQRDRYQRHADALAQVLAHFAAEQAEAA